MATEGLKTIRRMNFWRKFWKFMPLWVLIWITLCMWLFFGLGAILDISAFKWYAFPFALTGILFSMAGVVLLAIGHEAEWGTKP